jgi:hypothetical protein
VHRDQKMPPSLAVQQGVSVLLLVETIAPEVGDVVHEPFGEPRTECDEETMTAVHGKVRIAQITYAVT